MDGRNEVTLMFGGYCALVRSMGQAGWPAERRWSG
jgi:hypothetical protein